MDLSIAALLTQDGITNGAIYALLALALVLVFAVTRIIWVPSGEFVAEEYTQDDGVFSFHVAAGTWMIEARAAGAETAKEAVEVSSGEKTITVELQPA